MNRRFLGAIAALALSLGLTLGLSPAGLAQDAGNGAIGDTSSDSVIGETSGDSTVSAELGNLNPQGESNSASQTQNPTIDVSNSQASNDAATGDVSNGSSQTSAPSQTETSTGGDDTTVVSCDVSGTDDDEIDESEGGDAGSPLGVNAGACVQAPVEADTGVDVTALVEALVGVLASVLGDSGAPTSSGPVTGSS